MVSQYFGYKLRESKYVRRVLSFSDLKDLGKNDNDILKDIEDMQEIIERKSPGEAWEYAREAGHRISAIKDEKIIQIIDEFQFLNNYIYR